MKNWDSLDFIDETKIGDLAKQTVAANPFCTPTQHFMKYTFGRPRSEESIRRQPDFRFYPMKNQDFYLNYIKRTPLNQVPQAKKDKWIRIREQIILAIHNAGGKIMAGSDSPEFLFLYGYSLHRELKALNEAGLSNFAALQAATTNPAEFLRTSAQSGTLEKGKRADMVLLEANPLDEISNTTRQAGVFLRGEFYSQKELSKWLDEIAPRLHGALDKPTELPN